MHGNLKKRILDQARNKIERPPKNVGSKNCWENISGSKKCWGCLSLKLRMRKETEILSLNVRSHDDQTTKLSTLE